MVNRVGEQELCPVVGALHCQAGVPIRAPTGVSGVGEYYDIAKMMISYKFCSPGHVLNLM